MSKLEELINKLCPNGVEFKKIEEVCDNVFAGGTPRTSNKDYYGGNIPWLRSGEINFNIIDDAEIKITEKGLNESSAKWIKEYSVLIAMTGATVARSAVNIKRITANQSVCAMEPSEIVNYKFLYYYVESMYNNIKGMAQGALTSINLSIIKSISIPVPPLEVQCEIVRILDNFTLLSAELSAELSARQKQYDYYLNDLLNIKKLNPEKIMYVKDLFEIKNGLNKEKSAFGKGTPIVNFTDVYKNRYLIKEMLKGKVTLNDFEIERYKVLKGDVFFTRTSETRDDIGMSSAVIEDIEDCTFSGFVLRARPITNLLLPKFCAYYFSTNQVRDNIVRYASFTTRATTSGPKLAKIPVPIISLKEQERIVNILDKFDKLCNDISEGLPAEIEARKKQYEYYRDKLLTFKELK
ncbi:restriction endonuclease subunit S [Campylobacter devanensis]|uniref:restriction endonuclease subunit S n=1 Tax=Campylobacter devanensis TaxID=3161138 RepID=UPI000A347E22|nr:restriction endonuclease subunit S [Campylobacter sp. P148]